MARATRARVISAQFLQQLDIAMDNAVAAFDVRL
jgi:hypothetical protein